MSLYFDCKLENLQPADLAGINKKLEKLEGEVHEEIRGVLDISRTAYRAISEPDFFYSLSFWEKAAITCECISKITIIKEKLKNVKFTEEILNIALDSLESILLEIKTRNMIEENTFEACNKGLDALDEICFQNVEELHSQFLESAKLPA